jgi:uroporphyrinogen decarboxylase
MLNGRQRIQRALAGEATERAPSMPILHSGLPPMFDVPLGAFFTSAQTMADVIVRGCRTLGYDGVQLSLGVTGEAEALGARVDQPADGAPVLREHLLPNLHDRAALDALRARDPTTGGRMPLYFEAVERTVAAIGADAFVLAMLRGPLLAASQLCGVEPLLIGTLTAPDAVARILDVTTEVALRLGRWLRASGAHGLILGEATCSPNFISPMLYRSLVQPRHTRLVEQLRAAGWDVLGLHICGNLLPILEDVIATGVDLVDVDYQVPAPQAIAQARGRVTLRGNLDPSAVFRFGTPAQVRQATADLVRAVGGHARWVMSSGCDIPPGTPEENVHAFMKAVTDATSAP